MRLALSAFLLSALAGASSSPAIGAEAEAPGQPLVMFSTDYGLGIINGATNGPDRHAADVDDAYAVTLAIPATDVRAVVTTFGNDKAQPSGESARRGLSALGIADASKLVSVGAEGFLDAGPVSFVPDIDSGDVSTYCVNDGVRHMRSVLMDHEATSVTLFAIGPFTDIACLQRAFPDDYGRLKEIIALVGSSDGAPVLESIPVVDFNFAMDPTALGEVIAGDHSVPITFLMFEVSQLGSLTNEVISQWVASGTEAQRFYGLATQPHAAYWDAIFTQTDGQALFDAHTVYYFMEPDAYTCEDGMVATATVGGYPDTSASTSRNSLVVTSGSATSPTPGTENDGATYTYTGVVRGCNAFTASDGLESFEQAVADSIKAVSQISAPSE